LVFLLAVNFKNANKKEMPTMALSDTNVRNIKPGAKVQKLSDGGGLYLFVSPAGGKRRRVCYLPLFN